jgi:hypothetical protein
MARMNLRDLRQAHKYSDVLNFLMWSTGFAHRVIKRESYQIALPRHSFEHADEVGDVIPSDIAGKLPVSFPDRYQHVATIWMIILDT